MMSNIAFTQCPATIHDATESCGRGSSPGSLRYVSITSSSHLFGMFQNVQYRATKSAIFTSNPLYEGDTSVSWYPPGFTIVRKAPHPKLYGCRTGIFLLEHRSSKTKGMSLLKSRALMAMSTPSSSSFTLPLSMNVSWYCILALGFILSSLLVSHSALDFPMSLLT